MAIIVNLFRRLFKPRRHDRFTAQSGTIVIVSPSTDREKQVQVIDISLGGVAFIYDGSPTELEASGALTILAQTPYLEKVNFETVSDVPTSVEPYRRRGVMFKWMGVLEKAELKDFIKKVGIGHP